MGSLPYGGIITFGAVADDDLGYGGAGCGLFLDARGKGVAGAAAERSPAPHGGVSKAETSGTKDSKAALALKSHSEAERRRRERINSHLGMLRSLVPSSNKMEKAALLAEVIGQVKALKTAAAEVSRQHTIPSDTDELVVEPCRNGSTQGTSTSFLIRVSFCCEDRPELLVDLKKALRSLHLRTVHAELSTLGKRLKNVFVMAYDGNPSGINRQLLMNSVQQAIKSVVDRAEPQIEFAAMDVLVAKRRRLSPVDSFGSSSSGSHSSQLIF